MKNYRPVFGTIFIGLFALLVGGAGLLSSFGHNLFFSPAFSLTWIVVGLLLVTAVLLLTAAFWPRKKDVPVYSESRYPSSTTETMSEPERQFIPLTPAEAATGAYSLRGRVTADLRWIEPSDEATVVPLEATEGNISLLLNADTPIAIRLNMGSGAVAVNLGLGLHEVGEPALTNYSFATAGSRAILLGRGIAEIGEAKIVVDIKSPSANLRIDAN